MGTGYKSADIIRQIQAHSRPYFSTDLRKWNRTRKPLMELRLVIDLLGLFAIQKDEEGPKYDEITLPVKLKHWPHSVTNIRGILLPGQDACSRFSFELATDMCETNPAIALALYELQKTWIPAESSHSMASGRAGVWGRWKSATKDLRSRNSSFSRGLPTTSVSP